MSRFRKMRIVLAEVLLLALYLGGCICRPQEEKTEAENSDEEKPEAEYSMDSENLESDKIVFLGSYIQSDLENAEPDPIEWIVLEEKQNTLLLLTRFALDSKCISTESGEITWEGSDLRSWLNEDFINSAFTEEERERIVYSEVTPDPNPNFDSPQGGITLDRIFLLSTAEVQYYFSSKGKSLRCAPTEYAASLLNYQNDRYFTEDKKASCWWWLRTVGADPYSFSLVRIEGEIFNNGHFADSESGCIRPAMWVTVSDSNQ